MTDRTLRAAIAAGATTLDELARRCSAGVLCGGCRPALEELLARHEGERHNSGAPTAA